MDLRHSKSQNRIKENDVKKRIHSSCTKGSIKEKKKGREKERERGRKV